MNTDKMIHAEISEAIIGAAMKVLNTLRPGLDEKAYENALVIADPKVTEDFTPTHIAQMQGYLAITHLRLAMLLNFKHADLRWKRVVR